MHALLLLIASTPVLVDATGNRFELAADGAWPAGALIDASGGVTGAVHLTTIRSVGESHGLPRLDVFDTNRLGDCKIGDKREKLQSLLKAFQGVPGAMYMELARADASWKPYRQSILQLYKYKGKPRLRLRTGSLELLDAAGKTIGRAKAKNLAVIAGGRTRASAGRARRSAEVELLEGEAAPAVMTVDEFGWTLNLAGQWSLHDTMHTVTDRPSIGPLSGAAVPQKSAYSFIDAQGKEWPAPSLRWSAKPIEFDDGGPTGMKVEKRDGQSTVTLLHTR